MRCREDNASYLVYEHVLLEFGWFTIGSLHSLLVNVDVYLYRQCIVYKVSKHYANRKNQSHLIQFHYLDSLI